MRLKVDEKAGQVQIGDDDILPGILQSFSIGGAIIYETSGADKAQSKKKILSGYEDKTVNISLILTGEDENEYETIWPQVKQIEDLFMKTKDDLPVVYKIIHPMAKARNIDKVLFKNFSCDMQSGVKIVSANLEFIEFIPAQYEIIDKNSSSADTTANDEKTKKEKTFMDKVNESREGFLKLVGK